MIISEPFLTRYRRIVEPHHSNLPKLPKLYYVLDELLSTERIYVHEIESIIEFYVKPFENHDNFAQIPLSLRSQCETIFGNIYDLQSLHCHLFLPKLELVANSPGQICKIFVKHFIGFLNVYRAYCRNKPRSDALCRQMNLDDSAFFLYCRKRAGHRLPLSSYLLKPIQRITKYQLLLKELLRYCNDDPACHSVVPDIQDALSSMLNLLEQLNKAMINIS